MESKVCSKCNNLLSVDNFNYKKYKLKDNTITLYLRSVCKICSNIYKSNYYQKNKKELIIKQNIYYHKNQESVKKIIKKWRLENIDKFKECQKKYKINNPEKIKIIAKRRDKKAVIQLSDTYIINKITSNTTLKANIIRQYPELIEAKRLQILTKRICKTSQN